MRLFSYSFIGRVDRFERFFLSVELLNPLAGWRQNNYHRFFCVHRFSVRQLIRTWYERDERWKEAGNPNAVCLATRKELVVVVFGLMIVLIAFADRKPIEG